MFRTIVHDVDFCVVGGGLAGLMAAVAAARHGSRVCLMQERPILGGNASSEIRMWVSGALGKNNRETGLIEELELENHYRNPDKNYSIWDGIMYELANQEENIELLLNCSCNDCEMNHNRIVSVTGWQMTTQSFHKVNAKLFADCSGDSVLAPLTGAMFTVGRESRSEYHESIALEHGDKKTMGMSCLLQAREEQTPNTFIPPKWANHYEKKDLPYRLPNMSNIGENYWYIEVGGDGNSIDDTEKCREELLRIVYGIWDYIKNDPENKEKNKYWHLDWVGMLPGKRESRRYIGDHVMFQDELTEGGHFDDIVAYGGWSLDNHNPRGFKTTARPNDNYPVPSPYGIPYRCLYSKNIENLFFAGRNISVTHVVSSSARVMATCALLGQVVGTAAAIARQRGLSPRGVYVNAIKDLQQMLMYDDCYLPYTRRKISHLTESAELIADDQDCENLRNGFDRPIGNDDNGAYISLGSNVIYRFLETSLVTRVRLVFDSDMNKETLSPQESSLKRGMWSNRPKNLPETWVPKTLVRAFRIDGSFEGVWKTLVEENNNYQRLNCYEINAHLEAVRFTPITTWGCSSAHVFAFDVD